MKKPPVLIMLLTALFVSFKTFSLPHLSSLPKAPATIYLDFDGSDVSAAFWQQGALFTCAASGLTDSQVTEIFNRVSEDYRPFNINVTTDEETFLAAPLSSRIRVIVTPTSAWYPGVAGGAAKGSFAWGDDTPVFVFCDRLGPNNPKMVAECCSHEAGHSFGLAHQSVYDSICNLTAYYNEGMGMGRESWAPIMGSSYTRNITGWYNGTTQYGCNSVQDNLAIISGNDGVGYRKDDHSDDINNLPTGFIIADSSVTGVISTSTDKDAFAFTLDRNSIVHLAVKPFSVDSSTDEGANLDVTIYLYNPARELVRVYAPEETLSATIDTMLEAGEWYFVVDGGGNQHVSDYGSLGAYSIFSSATATTPIVSAILTGTDSVSKHILNWDIRTGENVQLISVESSTDGRDFNIIDRVNGRSKDFEYTPFQKTDLYYRIKATLASNTSVYSNVIRLKSVREPANLFAVSTFIHSEITIDAPEDYRYLLSDMNGRMITKGNGRLGFNRININNATNGMYVLQLKGHNQQQTERIIKL